MNIPKHPLTKQAKGRVKNKTYSKYILYSSFMGCLGIFNENQDKITD